MEKEMNNPAPFSLDDIKLKCGKQANFETGVCTDEKDENKGR
jgi:hypothetical protein